MSTGRLQVRRTLDVPLKEVSGICQRGGPGGEVSLIAVGDHSAKLAITTVSGPEDDPDWQVANIARLPGSQLPGKDPQIEAVCADGAGRVFLLQETPSRGELVDLDAGRIVASITLEVDGRDELARSWSDPDCSHGEGAVLLADGHLLVAKEKHPAALIEFGPAGEPSYGLERNGALADGDRWPIEEGKHRYVALGVWLPDKALADACEDFSDLAVGPDGYLYLLSDQSAAIARIAELSPGGGKVSLTAAWRIELDDKPEGLAFARDGSPIVAVDKRKAKNNLILLKPPIAAPG